MIKQIWIFKIVDFELNAQLLMRFFSKCFIMCFNSMCLFVSSFIGFIHRFLVKIPDKQRMTALPTSLRRTLLALLGFAVTIFIMVFYWNQTPPRPGALMNSIFTKPDDQKYVYRYIKQQQTIKMKEQLFQVMAWKL